MHVFALAVDQDVPVVVVVVSAVVWYPDAGFDSDFWDCFFRPGFPVQMLFAMVSICLHRI